MNSTLNIMDEQSLKCQEANYPSYSLPHEASGARSALAIFVQICYSAV